MEITIEKVIGLLREKDINLLSGGDDVYETQQEINDLIKSNNALFNFRMSCIFERENDNFKIVDGNYIFKKGINEESKEYIEFIKIKKSRERQFNKLKDRLELELYNYFSIVIPYLESDRKVDVESVTEFTEKWNNFIKTTLRNKNTDGDNSGK